VIRASYCLVRRFSFLRGIVKFVGVRTVGCVCTIRGLAYGVLVWLPFAAHLQCEGKVQCVVWAALSVAVCSCCGVASACWFGLGVPRWLYP
jgi:hypothetical protein